TRRSDTGSPRAGTSRTDCAATPHSGDTDGRVANEMTCSVAITAPWSTRYRRRSGRTLKPFGNYAASHDQTCIEPSQRLDHLRAQQGSEQRPQQGFRTVTLPRRTPRLREKDYGALRSERRSVLFRSASLNGPGSSRYRRAAAASVLSAIVSFL